MNLKEGKIMLEKINRLYDSMVLDSKIDQFEQELMLSYIKKLYVAFSTNGEQMNVLSNQNRTNENTSNTTDTSEPRIIRRVVSESPKTVTPPPSPVSDPEEELMEDIVEEEVKPMPKPQAKPAPAPSSKSAYTPPAVKTAPVVDNEEIAELFIDSEGKELSDKLASMPIHDLNKAMGLNEKILTVNELFNKDQQAFTTSMHLMNTMGNFDEAKVHLIELAQKYSWTEPDKMKKAQVFVRLVRRRYK